MLRILVLLCLRGLTFAGLRRTTVPLVSMEAFGDFIRRHFTSVVLHKSAEGSFQKEFEAVFSQIRGNHEIEDRAVFFATTDGIPQVNSDYYTGDEAIVLPNVAIYQGGSRKAWLVEPDSCQVDAPTSLSNASQVIDFVTARILPWVNPAHDEPEKYKSDAIVRGYLLMGDSTPTRREYLDVFHGVMLHCWQQGSSSATFSFSLHTASVTDSGIDQKITLQRRDGVSVEPFREFSASNLYFTLLQWVQKHAQPKILPATRCTKDQFFSKHDVVMFVFNLPLDELVADTQHLDWGIFTVNDDTLMRHLFDRYGLDPTDSPFRGVAIEKVYRDTGMYGRTKANEKYVFNGTSARDAIEAFKAGKLPRFFLSEPELETQQGHVKSIVGSTLDKFVSDSTHDVVMLFCTPWCGFCKEFEKKYQLLAQRLAASRPWLRFGKMDVTQNDNRWYDFYTSPQLHLFPHNSTEPIYFDLPMLGTEHFEEWVNVHTAVMKPTLRDVTSQTPDPNEL